MLHFLFCVDGVEVFSDAVAQAQALSRTCGDVGLLIGATSAGLIAANGVVDDLSAPGADTDDAPALDGQVVGIPEWRELEAAT